MATTIDLTELAILDGATVPTSFTPTIKVVGGSGNTIPVYSSTVAYYSVVGNICFVDVVFSGDGGAEGAGSGSMTIDLPAGLPAGASQPESAFPVGLGYNNIYGMAVYGQITQASSDVIQLKKLVTNVFSNFLLSDQDNATRSLSLKFWYYID